jgi:hypothetical protein
MRKALVVVLLKVLVGVLLGVFSFLVAMFVGGAAGTLPAFIAVAAFLFGCQFLLSWGHVDAHRKDWPVMLALAAPLLASTFMMVLVEPPETVLDQGPVLLFACAGIYAGAVTASRMARRTGAPLSPRARQ